MNKGFTLIETIIYIAIVSIILLAVVNFHFSLGGTASKLSANIDVSRNSRIALSSIDYLIRNADGLLKDVDSNCSTDNKLSLYFEDDTYLPGTCVGGGGGLDIDIEGERIILRCIPNIDNGYYGICNETVVNEYYLTSPNVKIPSEGLGIIISEVSDFPNIEVNLTVETIATEQKYLIASNTETSNISLRNEQDNGLLAWWKMDDVSSNPVLDYFGNNNATCSGLINAPGLVNDSIAAGTVGNLDYCEVIDKDSINFSDSFTLTAWIDPNDTSRGDIINKWDENNNLGYAMYTENNLAKCIVCDGNSCDHIQVYIASSVNDYFIACIYNRNTGEDNNFNIYSYEEGSPGTGYASIGVTKTILVNTGKDLYLVNDSLNSSNNFDGELDEIRIYNRALSSEEIYALMSQGNVTNDKK